jgi:hypothetical protein
LVIASASGCEVRTRSESKTLSESVSHSDAAKQQRFKEALSRSGIPFEVEIKDGREFVHWEAAYSAEVRRVEDIIFLPPGRHIHMDADRQSRFKAWLDVQGIPYRTMLDGGDEYIVWDDVNADRVRAWGEFPNCHDDPSRCERK